MDIQSGRCAVYLVGWRSTGPIKVGIATDPLKRLFNLQSACPYRLRLYAAWWLPDSDIARWCEQTVLAASTQHAMQGEWVNRPFQIMMRRVRHYIWKAGHKEERWAPTSAQLERRKLQLTNDKTNAITARSFEYWRKTVTANH